jgi:TusA-related sulfurtransferase
LETDTGLLGSVQNRERGSGVGVLVGMIVPVFVVPEAVGEGVVEVLLPPQAREKLKRQTKQRTRKEARLMDSSVGSSPYCTGRACNAREFRKRDYHCTGIRTKRNEAMQKCEQHLPVPARQGETSEESMTVLDCRGQECPLPVQRSREFFGRNPGIPFTVLVSQPNQAKNVSAVGERFSRPGKVEQLDDHYRVEFA